MSKSQRYSVGDTYMDSEGKKQGRGTLLDLERLPNYTIKVIRDLPGFEEDEQLMKWMNYASAYYDSGEHGKALQYLNWSIKKMPSLEPYIFYYIRVCERVVSIPLTEEEAEYELKLDRYRALPSWLRWTMPFFKPRLLRCKWCGRYTQYIDPFVRTDGLGNVINKCKYCFRMYPMPSWMWDSLDGRACSYYRLSFSEDEFYEEFEQDYDPEPLCIKREK